MYARERLLERLDHAIPFACTWVTAPAGYGKTSLARTYVERVAAPSLWYTLDRSDSDLATFFADFSGGLRTVARDAPLLQYSADIQDPVVFARAYFGHAFSHLPRPLLLVLDDYHEVAPHAPLHTVVSSIIGALPQKVRLIILSRQCPPAEFARAETYDLVERVEVNELRLTPAEGLAIARLRRPAESLDLQRVETLLEQTDGWAAGFVLLGRHPAEHLPLLRATEVLFEYFAREVLAGATEEVRDLLLRTAWLPSMTVEMVHRVTGRQDAQRQLHALLEGNYFLSQTAGPVPSYRYHALFRQFLLHYAEAAWSAEEVDHCRRLAGQVLADDGQIDAAVALWLDLEDWDSLTRLIRRTAPTLLEQARTQSLNAWLGGIPGPAVDERPWLQYWSGRAQLYQDPIAARRRFEQAYGQFKEIEEPEGVFLSWAGVCETYWIALDGTDPLRGWLAELEVILARWPNLPTAEIEVQVAFGAFFALSANDPRNARMDMWEQRLLDALESDQPPNLRLAIANLLMFHYVWTMGDRGRAALVLETLRKLAAMGETAPLGVILGRTWGDYAYEYSFRGSMEECQRIVERALVTASERGGHLYDPMLWSILAFVHLTAGQPSAAQPFLDNISGILDSARVFDRGSYYALRAWEAWLDGRLAEAREAARTSNALAKRFGNLPPIWITTLLLFQIDLSLGEKVQALQHLSRMRKWLRRPKSGTERFQWALALAQLALNSGRLGRCQRLLRAAFALGRREGYVGVNYFKIESLSDLCAVAIDAGIEVDYARNLIRTRSLVPPVGALATERWPWPVIITTFGGLALRVNGEPVQWSRKAQHKPVDLLRVLIAFGGRRVPGARVIDELWPQAEGDAAESTLKTTLHRLRKILGRADALQVQEGKISLNPACIWVDRWALEEVLDAIPSLVDPTNNQPTETLDSSAQRLLGLYHGRFLDETDLACALKPRNALHSRYVLAIERLGARFEALGMRDRAARCYEHVLKVDPAATGFHQKLEAFRSDLNRTPTT